MTDHIKSRSQIIRSLREEVLGPASRGRILSNNHPLVFDSKDEFYGPHIQAGSLNEIIKGESPKQRFGAGVLFPVGEPPRPIDEDLESAEKPEPELVDMEPLIVTESAQKKLDEAIERTRGGGGAEKEGDELGISLANQLKPSSMGVSFLANLAKDSKLIVFLKGGRYRSRSAYLASKDGKDLGPRNWWFRSLVVVRAEFSGADLLKAQGMIAPGSLSIRNGQGLKIDIRILGRNLPAQAAGEHKGRLYTVSVVNRSELKRSPGDTKHEHGYGSKDQICLFQAEFSVSVASSAVFCPYPERLTAQMDDEERSLALLYRNAETFATGHGCAADWRFRGTARNRAIKVRAVPMPFVEVPGTTPDVIRPDKSKVLVDMRSLAGLVKENNGLSAIYEVVELYASWIATKEKEVSALELHQQTPAKNHLDACRTCYERMKAGIKLLESDSRVLRAFQLANHAVLLQQERSFREARAMTFDSAAMRLTFAAPPPVPPGRGTWRPFQIAFLLMSLRSAIDGRAPDRDTVELIWFPTGGGKTEAYLGLTAFALFHRRLTNPKDDGTHVLMRYTLRLLTAQQFQRASGLICAMEHLRRNQPDRALGERTFSIGIWLGGDTTPNKRADALASFRKLERGEEEADYNFVLLRCPWCGAQMGPVRRRGGNEPTLLGVQRMGGTIQLHCPDQVCDFARKLPIEVVDEDLYAKPPDLVIGTIDKFAGLAWNPEARALFGLDEHGARHRTPPSLIIQDELHLITGPLGSMAGLYETLVEELCTIREGEKTIRPKIVSSTATTRRYTEQVRALYGRKETCLFPPPGLEAGDSFFATYDRKSDGRLADGRIFVGINAPSYPSGPTSVVRVFASLLQAARLLPDNDARDPWWTLLTFFNSLRELGMALTLFQGDIPEHIREISRRHLPDPSLPVDPKTGRSQPVVRYIGEPLELTGRLTASEIPDAISQLEREYQPTTKAVDVCLASNIIEVGVDIDRLSLMAVTGQPKTTAQYIQVTGRVGRRKDRPGLVAMIYSTSKPRDRSHFERFRSYHERLYAQVEPASVTPFATPVLERALHAVLVGYVRQFGDLSKTDTPLPEPIPELRKIKSIVLDRVKEIEPAALPLVEILINQRLHEWLTWQRDRWNPEGNLNDPSLLRYTSGYYPPTWNDLSWPTQSSMRSVDAECRPEITVQYARDAAAAAAPIDPLSTP